MSELRWQGDCVYGTYINFVRVANSESGKTQVWRVNATETKEVLGFVKWYSKWRQYCFEPNTYTLFEKTCLKEMSQFLVELMELRKKSKHQLHN